MNGWQELSLSDLDARGINYTIVGGAPPDVVKPKVKHPRTESVLEVQFDILMQARMRPWVSAMVKEYLPFEYRKIRADRCWPDLKVVVEIDGNCHRIKGRFNNDALKHNLYVTHGWTYLRITGDIMRNDIATDVFIDQLTMVLERAKNGTGITGSA